MPSSKLSVLAVPPLISVGTGSELNWPDQKPLPINQAFMRGSKVALTTHGGDASFKVYVVWSLSPFHGNFFFLPANSLCVSHLRSCLWWNSNASQVDPSAHRWSLEPCLPKPVSHSIKTSDRRTARVGGWFEKGVEEGSASLLLLKWPGRVWVGETLAQCDVKPSNANSWRDLLVSLLHHYSKVDY